EVAKLLRDAVRDSDTVGRLGGDEFGTLLIGCPLDKARQIADDLTRSVGEYRFVWKDKIFNIGVSVGLVEISRESGTLEELLAAERYRLMGLVDRWVVQQTFTAIASGALPVPARRSVAINVSGQTLDDSQFLEFVVECFDSSGVAPSQVCFEMSENAVVANLDHARRFVGVLHGMGCQFTLDDFGSGMGSFSNLKNL